MPITSCHVSLSHVPIGSVLIIRETKVTIAESENGNDGGRNLVRKMLAIYAGATKVCIGVAFVIGTP